MKLLANLTEWLSSKKTKHSITASVPLIGAGMSGEMQWGQVLLALAGVWMMAGFSQGIADHGKSAAQINAMSTAEKLAELDG